MAKFSSADPQARTIVHSMGFYEREVGFYSQFAADCPIRTPRCFFGAVEMDTGASILVLEDLTWMHNLNSTGGSLAEVTADERSEVAFIDWQLATGARAAIDLASFICSHLDTPERRHNEQRLLASYHSVLDIRWSSVGTTIGSRSFCQPADWPRRGPPSRSDSNARRVLEHRIPALCHRNRRPRRTRTSRPATHPDLSALEGL